MVLTCESVDEILKCVHSSESYWEVLSCGTVFSLWMKSFCDQFNERFLGSLYVSFLWYYLSCYTRYFELWYLYYDYSNEISQTTSAKCHSLFLSFLGFSFQNEIEISPGSHILDVFFLLWNKKRIKKICLGDVLE